MKDLYRDHVATRQAAAERALEETGFTALVLHSGTQFHYFGDDMHAPHHSNPHFASWVPLPGDEHLMLVRPGKRPLLVRVAPEDYWYEQAPLGDPFWADAFEIVEVATPEEAWKRVKTKGYVAYLGDAPTRARAQRIEESGLNPTKLTALLDWDRSFKTEYEIACLEEAQRAAARGHHAAREAFVAGQSELEIHHAFVRAVGCVDHALPYESIVALDEKGAILHYLGKRTDCRGDVLLIDSGALHNGYASDITRTWTTDGCDARFRDLVSAMDTLQQGLCDQVLPGLPYPDLHHLAHVRIGTLLHDLGILKLGGEDAVAKGLTRPFFPHGLGHFLGIQVHDVAGHQASPAGGRNEPPELHPFLRTTRTIDVGQVFTIEPGVYFIPMLLREYRDGADSGLFDWTLIDALTRWGGVRIEDNVLVTPDGHRNLTRPLV